MSNQWMRRLLALCSAAILLLSACGSGKNPAAEPAREQVTVALWSDQLTERYTGYLQDRFPEVDFTFYVATNSTDFYRFKMERGDLPDILTVRRFALRDVSDWRDQLMDLSDTELANTFPQAYLRSYTYSDGAVNWLPACAEVDSIVVDRVLFEENDIPVPINYQSFVEACGLLQERGIRPFLSNFDADYTCMEILQGLSVEQLTSQAGREWRQQYESGQTDQLSEEVWLPVFQRMEEFIGYTGMTAGDLALAHTDVLAAFQNGELGMMRGTGNESAIRDSVNGEHLLMPYFGGTEEEGWYLTYPAFQIAARTQGTEDPARKQLILDIMSAMLDQDGLEHIASGQNMIPYNRGVELELSPELAYMQPYIEDNRLYIRLASSDMFSVSKTVVQGMIDGTYPDARSAFDAFNRMMEMGAEANWPGYFHIDTGYPHAFDPQRGSQAASAVMNSLREEMGTQFLLGPAAAVAGNITAGDYTTAELNFLTAGESPSIAVCQMNGEQLYQYVEYLFGLSGVRGAVVNNSTLYVSSGFEMTVQKTDDGYQLEQLSVDGQELDRSARFDIAVLGSTAAIVQKGLEQAGVTQFDTPESGYKQMIADRLTGGAQLAKPTDYITLR